MSEQPNEPPRGRDTPTGTDPEATYDEPGYEDKSLGQAVDQDEELAEQLVRESDGDLEEAEWRFGQESAGAPAAARQLRGTVDEASREGAGDGDDGDDGVDLASRSVTIDRDDENGRYELRIDGALAARAHFEQRADHVVVAHTEVRKGVGGRGLGSVLAKGLLEDVRGRGLDVVPECPFVREYLERHPAYQDLVASTG